MIYLDCDESHSFLRQGQYLLPYPPYPTGCRNLNTSRRLTLEPDVKQELHVISNETVPLCLRYVYSGVFKRIPFIYQEWKMIVPNTMRAVQKLKWKEPKDSSAKGRAFSVSDPKGGMSRRYKIRQRTPLSRMSLTFSAPHSSESPPSAYVPQRHGF